MRKLRRLGKKKSTRRQTGKSNISRDKRYKALHPGKRISKSGRKYYEYRANRSDINRRKKL